MNTVDFTVKTCILEYPSLFAEVGRLDVLDHLFLTIGNGYHWADGCILENGFETFDEYVAYTEQNLVSPAKKIATFDDWMKDYDRSFGGVTKRELKVAMRMWKKDLDEALLAERDIDRLTTEMQEPTLKTMFYPPCKGFSAIFKIPADARPEWVQAAKDLVASVMRWVELLEGLNGAVPEDPDDMFAFMRNQDLKYALSCLDSYRALKDVVFPY